MTATPAPAPATEAELALREVAQAARDKARHFTGLLRVLTGYAHNTDQPMTDTIMGLAIQRAERHELANFYLTGYRDAAATYYTAMAALTRIKPDTTVSLRLYNDGRP